MVCAGYYERNDVPDRNGDLRRAIVFELVAPDDERAILGDVERRVPRPTRAGRCRSTAARVSIANGRGTAERHRGKTSHPRAKRGPAHIPAPTRSRPVCGMRLARTVPHGSRAPLPRPPPHEAPLRWRPGRLSPRHCVAPHVPSPGSSRRRRRCVQRRLEAQALDARNLNERGDRRAGPAGSAVAR
jgi:hypothetical protein